MIKLLLTDLRLLGDKLWKAPLVVTVIMLSIILFGAFITKQPLQYVNLVLTPIILVTLSFILMKLHDGGRLHTLLNSYPFAKNILVIEKYVLLLIFFIFAAMIEYVLASFVNLFSDKDNTRFFLQTTNAVFLGLIRTAIFLLPLYFKVKDSMKTFAWLLAWFSGLITIHLSITMNMVENYTDSFRALFIYVVLFVASLLVMYAIYLKDRKRTGLKELLIIPVVSILPVSFAITFEALQRIVFSFSLYRLSENKPDYGRYEWTMDRYIDFFETHFIVTVIISVIIFIIYKNSETRKMLYNSFLVVFLPVIFFSIENSLRMVIELRRFLIGSDFISDHLYSVSQYIVFIPMLIVSIYYSKKFLTEGGK
jgi:hypothetical protein